MIQRKDTNLWQKKTWDPSYHEIVNGRKKIDVRLKELDFPVKFGDWIVFKWYTRKNDISFTYMKQQCVRAVTFVMHTDEVNYWPHKDDCHPFTIIQLEEAHCHNCFHVVDLIYDEDGHDMSYFQCNNPLCTCICNEEIDLTYKN